MARVFKKMQVIDSPPTSVDGRLDAPVHFTGFTYDGGEDAVKPIVGSRRLSGPVGWEFSEPLEMGQRKSSGQNLQLESPKATLEARFVSHPSKELANCLFVFFHVSKCFVVRVVRP